MLAMLLPLTIISRTAIKPLGVCFVVPAGSSGAAIPESLGADEDVVASMILSIVMFMVAGSMSATRPQTTAFTFDLNVNRIKAPRSTVSEKLVQSDDASIFVFFPLFFFQSIKGPLLVKAKLRVGQLPKGS
jgi:hypothetical protein